VLSAATLAILLLAGALPADERHPVPDVYFFYELRIERGRLYLLHETRWTDQVAQDLLRDQVDQDGDFQVSEIEGSEFARRWAERVVRTFRVEIQGEPVHLGEAEVNFDTYIPTARDLERLGELDAEAIESVTDLEAYQGLSWEFRVYLDFEIPLPSASPVQVDLFEKTYQEEESEGLSPWATNAISAYGEDGLSILRGTPPGDPRRITEHIELVFDWSGKGPSAFDWKELENPDEELRDILADVIRGKVGLVLGLILALVYGMGHAIAPGHGKAMVAAYLIGTRGRIRDAVSLGLIVTLTHTSAIMLVAILAGLYLQGTERRELEQYLGIASGVGILLIGLWLLIRNSRAWIRKEPLFGHHHHGDHDHHHHHHHHHHHDHDDHSHDHHDGDHAPAHGHHHHRVPTSFRELLGLGAMGGIVPCPAAVVVCLWALQNDYVWMATLVVGAFSLGLAVVLVVIGLMMVSSTRTLERISRSRDRLKTLLLVLPLASSILLLGVGVLVTWSALQLGPG
jgi:nickel/cobalt exporter